jgi:hypothetical protein
MMPKRIEVADPTNPAHYTSHPGGIETIDVIEHMPFCLGNVVKYVWRFHYGKTGNITDLKKAAWYLQREIKRQEQCGAGSSTAPGGV